MKLLATGRDGQVGQSLVERSAGQSEIDLVALGRAELDLAKPGEISSVIAAHAPDVVINAGAYTAVDQAEDEPDLAMAINGEGAAALADAAARAGARMIQLSTDYVFDGTSPQPYDEAAATNPIGAYGRSKLDGEQRVREILADHVIIRTAWVYSPFGHNFVKTMIGLSRSRGEVAVVADQQGSPTSALDLADGLLAIVRRWQSGDRTGLGQTYHLAGGGSASWCDLAQEVFKQCAELGVSRATARPIATSEWPTRAPRPANSMLDSAKIRRDFGIALPDWQASVKPVVARIALG
jgi:dTDP-4-dehydrorhamnose reductase